MNLEPVFLPLNENRFYHMSDSSGVSSTWRQVEEYVEYSILRQEHDLLDGSFSTGLGLFPGTSSIQSCVALD